MERPIGYWLKHLDRLIEAAAEQALAEERLTRRHWQIMNTLHGSPQTPGGLAETLRPFWGPGSVTLEDVTGELTRRGWLTLDGSGRHALTPDGRAGHAMVREKMNGVRSTFLTGLTEAEYLRTVQSLRHMTGNLERAAGGVSRPG
ncbi:MarR family transcriptional regulator [Streptosporangium sp. NPDC004379]|uniref:MarR family transcriptional regulator n=1 Tax=Streptosporangium sp. NPDC004379 TaxID=3366189 RepID=UPI0036AB017C